MGAGSLPRARGRNPHEVEPQLHAAEESGRETVGHQCGHQVGLAQRPVGEAARDGGGRGLHLVFADAAR